METPRQNAAPVIDTHAHVYTLDMPQTGSAWHQPPADAATEDYLETLDKAGVRFGVLAAASTYGEYNDYSLEATRNNPRLRTTVIVNPDTDACVLREMNVSGAVGIRLQFRNVATPPDLTSYEYRRLFRRVADLGWHVHLHDDGHRLPKYIDTLIAAGPRLVVDHMGRPSLEHGTSSDSFRAVMRAVERGNTWVKLSSGFRLASQEFSDSVAATLLSEVGPERLMWGSDWPFAAFENSVTYGSALNDYYRVVPDIQVRYAIDRTALAFYFS
jgi:predicted TIM-barrel fold metal-dependent hydrolase